MCVNCMSQFDMATITAAGGVAAAGAGVKQFLWRVGLYRPRSRHERDVAAASYLDSIGLDGHALIGVARGDDEDDAGCACRSCGAAAGVGVAPVPIS